MADCRILNLMHRGFTLQLPNGGSKEKPLIKVVHIAAKEAVTVDKDRFDAALKGNKMLQSLVDQKRLVVGKSSGAISTPDDSELHKRTSDLVRPADLTDTKNSDDGKVKHKATVVETVEAEVVKDAPKGGKRGKGKK